MESKCPDHKGYIVRQRKGAKRNIVLLNAGATLYAGGMCSSIEEGIKLAQKRRSIQEREL